MKRTTVLRHVRKFLISQNIESTFEVRILPQPLGRAEAVEITKRRLLFVTGLQRNDQQRLTDFMADHNVAAECFHHRNLDAFDVNPDEVTDEFSLENNFRGRVLRAGEDFNWNYSEAQFDSAFLKSIFRLILSKVNDDYFGRHDIAPIFFNPGHSTAGFPDFLGAVQGMVKYLNHGRRVGRTPADPDFDYINVFVSNQVDAARASRYIRLGGFTELRVRELFARIDESSEAETVNWLYGNVNRAWRR